MKRSETVLMLTYLDRIGMVAYKPGMEDAWFDVVSHISADDARVAVRRLAEQGLPEGRFVARPSDVVDGVHQIRRERVSAALEGAAPLPPREIDPDDVGAYQAWRKAFLKALGDGRSLRDAESVACQVVGIPVVHRGVEAHQVRRLESS